MKYKGFTLIEIILVIAIITGLGAFMIPTTINQIYYSRAESIASVLASSIYMQQQYSFNGYESSEYGLKIESDRILLYTGTSYATNTYVKEISTDGATLVPNIGGGNEIHFDNNSLKPSHYGTIISSYAGVDIPVIINSEGLAYVQR